jgi:hypothetical protein
MLLLKNIADKTLPMNTIPISIVYQGMQLKGYAASIKSFNDAMPSSLMIYIQGWYLGTLSFQHGKWSMDEPIDQVFVDELGDCICSYMKSVKFSMRYRAL